MDAYTMATSRKRQNSAQLHRSGLYEQLWGWIVGDLAHSCATPSFAWQLFGLSEHYRQIFELTRLNGDLDLPR
jgi:hypothetical protein